MFQPLRVGTLPSAPYPLPPSPTLELGVLAKLRASVVREKWSFLKEEDMRGPLLLVLWMKSGPSFTGGACKLRVRCRSSSAGQGGKATREPQAEREEGRGRERGKLQPWAVGGGPEA